jgi:hypothetical protein
MKYVFFIGKLCRERITFFSQWIPFYLFINENSSRSATLDFKRIRNKCPIIKNPVLRGLLEYARPRSSGPGIICQSFDWISGYNDLHARRLGRRAAVRDCIGESCRNRRWNCHQESSLCRIDLVGIGRVGCPGSD